MKEQKGVPLSTGGVIRFDQPGGSSTSDRYRVPAGSIHRAGHSINHHPEDVPYSTDDFTPQIARSQRQPRPAVFADADYGDDTPRRTQSHTTARRLDRHPLETRVLPRRQVRSGRVLIVVGLSLLVMLMGFMALSWLGNWWTTTTNDWMYGRPRTFQIDHVVGHHDSPQHPSHFIALNLRRQVLVIELPGGDASKAVTYLGPVLLEDGQDLMPVTLSFEDRNGDGKPDLNMHIGDQVIVFRNDGTKFVSPQQQ
ncbi:MAG: hypothetical protein ACRDIV_10350 [Ktedonobacteraceae bacterium]